jgi:hypothetical protein
VPEVDEDVRRRESEEVEVSSFDHRSAVFGRRHPQGFDGVDAERLDDRLEHENSSIGGGQSSHRGFHGELDMGRVPNADATRWTVVEAGLRTRG